MLKRLAFLVVAIVIVVLASCKAINKDAISAWTSGDVSMMQDLTDYRTAQGKSADDLKAHSAKAFGDITADEENLLMAELLADIKADPKRSQARKDSYSVRIQAHLNLFNSLKS